MSDEDIRDAPGEFGLERGPSGIREIDEQVPNVTAGARGLPFEPQITAQPSLLYPDHSPPRVVLVCTDCEIYFEHKSGWEHCPKCASDLLEMNEA